mmetsp:Transcript_7746/g.28568  ORF Transcript_7746/g.28568 Transcript_7746/m.28568 type:complete len:471 (-) Transcript_7746:1179-2591(-)
MQQGFRPPLVPTRFVWPYGGQRVLLCGSFTGWNDMISLSPCLDSQGNKIFAVTIRIPAGYHQFKYIVDNEWRHDDAQPFVPSPLGPPNNCILVPAEGVSNSNQQAPAEHVLPPGHGPSDIGREGPMELDEPPSPGLPGQGMPPPITQEDMTASRQMLQEFLRKHTAYELLPESGRVTVLDIDLPVQHAFYALFQQDIHVAPIWDNGSSEFVGMVHPGDFVRILYDLQRGMHNQALSEAEVESHTLRKWRSRDEANGNAPRPFAYVGPDSSLQQAGLLMLKQNLEELPILASDHDPEDKCLLHMARVSEILASLSHHFRHIVSALPVLAQPLGALNVGWWLPGKKQTDKQLRTLQIGSPLTAALEILTGGHQPAVPIVDAHGGAVATYSLEDITSLARDQLYLRVQLEELTVRDALAYGGWDVAAAESGNPNASNPSGGASGTQLKHCPTCTEKDTLRSVLELLAMPQVKR